MVCVGSVIGDHHFCKVELRGKLDSSVVTKGVGDVGGVSGGVTGGSRLLRGTIVNRTYGMHKNLYI